VSGSQTQSSSQAPSGGAVPSVSQAQSAPTVATGSSIDSTIAIVLAAVFGLLLLCLILLVPTVICCLRPDFRRGYQSEREIEAKNVHLAMRDPATADHSHQQPMVLDVEVQQEGRGPSRAALGNVERYTSGATIPPSQSRDARDSETVRRTTSTLTDGGRASSMRFDSVQAEIQRALTLSRQRLSARRVEEAAEAENAAVATAFSPGTPQR